jgi:hypothetical protein
MIAWNFNAFPYPGDQAEYIYLHKRLIQELEKKFLGTTSRGIDTAYYADSLVKSLLHYYATGAEGPNLSGVAGKLDFKAQMSLNSIILTPANDYTRYLEGSTMHKNEAIEECKSLLQSVIAERDRYRIALEKLSKYGVCLLPKIKHDDDGSPYVGDCGVCPYCIANLAIGKDLR